MPQNKKHTFINLFAGCENEDDDARIVRIEK